MINIQYRLIDLIDDMRGGKDVIFQSIRTAADIMRIAMVQIQGELEKQQMKSRMVLTVHDELVFEAPPDERGPLESIVLDRMQHAVPLSVPTPVESGWGPSWGGTRQ